MEEENKGPWVMDDWSDLMEKTAGIAAQYADRKPLLSGPKRQHFLPRFYLAGFGRNGFLAVYDRKQNQIRLQKPEDTGVIGHFYTSEDEQGQKRYELEQTLSEVESSAAPLIRKLESKEPLLPEEREHLAVFIALSMFRTPDLVDSLKLANGQMVKQMARFSFGTLEKARRLVRNHPDCPESEEELEKTAERLVKFVESDDYDVETHHQWALGMSLNMFSAIAPILVARNWLVLHSDSEKRSFITSDAPLILTTTARRDGQHKHRGIGFASNDALVVFPLTASCALMILGEGGGLRHKTSGSAQMRSINLTIAEYCQRFVIGRDEALVRSLVDCQGLAHKAWKPRIQTG